jgi:hypothetical protein
MLNLCLHRRVRRSSSVGCRSAIRASRDIQDYRSSPVRDIARRGPPDLRCHKRLRHSPIMTTHLTCGSQIRCARCRRWHDVIAVHTEGTAYTIQMRYWECRGQRFYAGQADGRVGTKRVRSTRQNLRRLPWRSIQHREDEPTIETQTHLTVLRLDSHHGPLALTLRAGEIVRVAGVGGDTTE